MGLLEGSWALALSPASFLPMFHFPNVLPKEQDYRYEFTEVLE
jgi:hypothetical protein